MTRDAAVFLLLVLAGAAFGLAHLVLCFRIVHRGQGFSRTMRLLACFPPFTAWAGLRTGARGLTIAWTVLLVAYGVLRALR